MGRVGRVFHHEGIQYRLLMVQSETGRCSCPVKGWLPKTGHELYLQYQATAELALTLDPGLQEQAPEEQPPMKRAKLGGASGQAATEGLNEMGESEEEDDELRPVEASSGDEEDTELLVPKAPKDCLTVAFRSS